MTRIASPTAVARRLDFVRETAGPNRGAWVQFIQRAAGGQPGDSWCAEFVSMVLNVCYDGAPPLPPARACQAMLDEGRRRGYEVTAPQIDDLFFYLDGNAHAHHVGIVTAAAPLSGIAGNTSEDGRSSNGTGVFEHGIAGRMAFLRLPQ